MNTLIALSWWQMLLALLGILTIILILRGAYIWWTRVRPQVPSLHRDWEGDCAFTPRVHIEDGVATFSHVRDFTWRTTRDRDENWTERSVVVDELVDIWYIVDHFHRIKAMAHTMVSFEFRDGTILTASFEVRREKGERYHPWHGLWRAYELYLAWGTERDLIGVRTNARGNQVHMYRVTAPQEKKKAVFLEMCKRTEELANRAEWYHSLFSTCLTAIVRQVNLVTPGRIPFTWRYLVPGYSAKAAHRLGLIEDWGGLEETMTRGRVDKIAVAAPDTADFSHALRAYLPSPPQSH